MVLEFANLDHFAAVLFTKTVPVDILRTPVRWSVEMSGLLHIAPTVSIPRTVVRTLKQQDVKPRRLPGLPSETAETWWQVLPFSQPPDHAESFTNRVILEWKAKPDLVQTVMEITRLGGIVRSWMTGPKTSVFLDVENLPTFTQLGVEEHDSVCLYHEIAAGVWIEWGHHHALLRDVHPPAGESFAFSKSGTFHVFADSDWVSFSDDAGVLVSLTSSKSFEMSPAKAIDIPLQLRVSPAENSARFWIVPRDEFLAWVPTVQQSLLESLEITTTKEEMLVRVREGYPPPVMVWNGDAFEASRVCPEVCVPIGWDVSPALRRDLFRTVLPQNDEAWVWLTAGKGRQAEIHGVARWTFQPLMEWVKYHIADVEHWQAVDFNDSLWEEERWTVRRPEPRTLPRTQKTALETEQSTEDDEEPQSSHAPRKSPARPTRELKELRSATQTSAAWQKRLSEWEATFFAKNVPADSSQLRAVWWGMAECHLHLHQFTEGLLCAAYAWAGSSDLSEFPAAWNAAIEAVMGDSGDRLRVLSDGLKQEKATSEDVSRWLLVVISAAHQSNMRNCVQDRITVVRDALHRIEHILPMRVAWLGWRAVAELSGRDGLLLARTRDRFLARLFHRRIRWDSDLPDVLKRKTQDHPPNVGQTGMRLRDFPEIVSQWSARNAGSQKNETASNLDLVMAWGLAKSGEELLAEERLTQAQRQLERTQDSLHQWIGDAYSQRIAQAAEDVFDRTELSTDLQTRYEQFTKRQQFQLDRIRQSSAILEPTSSEDSFLNYHRVYRDDLARELAEWKRLTEGTVLIRELKAIEKPDRSRDEQQRILLAGLEVAPRIDAAFAEAMLTRSLTWCEYGNHPGLPLLVNMLGLAAHFQLAESVNTAAHHLGEFLRESQGVQIAALNQHAFFTQTFPQLRRFGLDNELREFLEICETLRGKSAAETAQLMLQLAGGWFSLGEETRAWPAIERGFDDLCQRRFEGMSHVKLAIGFLRAMGLAPAGGASEWFSKFFYDVEGITDSFSTSTHVFLSQLSVVEAFVFAVARDGMHSDPAIRLLLDEEELSFRRQIHRDVAAAISSTSG